MHRRPLLTVVVALATLLTRPAHAQQPVAEVGVDVLVRAQLTGDAAAGSVRPVPSLRFGVIVSDRASVETSIGASALGGTMSATVGGLVQLTGSTRAGGAFVRPFVLVDAGQIITSTGSVTIETTDVRLGAGIGLGVRGKWTDRLAWRLEGVAGALKSSNWSVILQPRAGVSIYF